MSKHIIGGIEFDEKTYKSIINNYSETFTHTSLSIEKEFIKLEQYNNTLKSVINDNDKAFEKLSDSEKAIVTMKYHYFVTYMAFYKGMMPQIDFNNQEIIDATYEENFKEFDNYMTKLLVIDNNGHVSLQETGKNISIFFPTYIERKPVLKRAQDSKKDHINGFLYALNLDHIGPGEIIKINEIINSSNPEKQLGFKKVNNAITGATFNTMKKEEIPIQIAELIYKYDHNFDMEIKNPSEKGISDEERYERLFLICLKEARFHIMFEHIHPFADGNGRTGRIIMSTNLIRQHLAPPLITSVMLEQYKKFINDYDYKGLAQMIFDSSSQTLSTWVTKKRENEGLSFEEMIDSKTI